MKRFLIAMMLTLTLLAAIPANPGVRHETAVSLSEAAAAYYTGERALSVLSASEGSGAAAPAEVWASPLCQALRACMDGSSLPAYPDTLTFFAVTDASGGSSEPLLFYSDAVGPYQREQVWADARGNFYRDGAGRDLHHLRPADGQVNLTRADMSFGSVRACCAQYQTLSIDGEPVLWYDPDWDLGRGLVEVRDCVKGDVARILLYVWVVYGGPDGENQNLWTDLPPSGSGMECNDGLRVIESAETLLDWCRLDPVDTWELGRNDAVEAIQGTRNVFIDYPELAFLLLGRDVPDMPTPSGWAHSLHCTVSAAAEPPEGGSVTVSGHTVAAASGPGYEIVGWTLTPPDAAAVTREENVFTLTALREDCLLTVCFGLRDPCADGHAWDEGTVTRPPTQQEAGERTYTCTRCGAVRTEPIPFRFDDVADETAWYFDAVYWALAQQPPITAGVDAAHFAPTRACTRAELVSFLWRAAGEPTPEGESCPFSDVPEGAYYRAAVLWAAERGIVFGTAAETFSPRELCTRAQVVTFLWRMAGSPEPQSAACPFADVPERAYYRRAVLWAAEQGIACGTAADRFSPKAPCTRAAAVTFLWRASRE